MKTAFRTKNSQFSPNGRWLSYTRTSPTEYEIYVQGFNPDPHGRAASGRSRAGGTEARWRADGKELYYYSGKGIMAVDVKSDGASFEAGIPKLLFDARVNTAVGRNHLLVTKDGQRFLVLTPSRRPPMSRCR